MSWWTIIYCNTYARDVLDQHISVNVEAMMAVPHQNVANVYRDGESVSKVCLKAAIVDWVVTLSQNRPPCSWTFFTSWFFHAAASTSGIRDTIHHPYISTCF